MRRFIAFFFLLIFLGGCTTKYQEIRDCRSVVRAPQETGAPYDPGKAVLYGRFISLAYAMYQKSPGNLTPEPAPDFPFGYQLTAWVQMQDFVLGNTAPLFYGFIAHSSENPSRAILAIRGTANDVEWWDDSNALGMTPFPVANCGNVALGFERIYATLEVVERSVTEGGGHGSLKGVGSFSAQVAEHLRRHAAKTPGAAAPEPTIEVTGHSLGAPLATYYVAENALVHKIRNPVLYTFASPRVGDRDFTDVFNSLGLTSWRIVNKADLVPRLPPALFFQHVNAEKVYDSIVSVRPTVACQHAMTTYLHLIDPAIPLDTKCRLPKRRLAADP
jgi:hypothetical protein